MGWNDMVANTTANWNGLMDMYDHTTAIYSLPEAVYSQGLTQVFNDVSTDAQELAKYSAALSAYNEAVAAQLGELHPTGTLPPIPTFPDLYNDPVLNPVSALTLLVQNSLSSGFGANAAEVGLTGVYQNMLPSINDVSTQFSSISTQVENLFTGGSFSMGTIDTDFTNIGTDITNIDNFLSLAPSTLLNDYLNGYQVQSAAPDPLAGTVPSIGDAYTLNAPFTANDNVSITPEFGLLTNPDAVFTTDTSGFGDGTASSFLGTSPLETGTLAALLQSEQTLSDELLTVTSTVPGSGVTAPDPTGVLTILGPDTLSFNLDLSQIPVIGDAITFINDDVIPALNGTLTTAVNAVNTAISGLNDTIAPVVNGVIDIYNGCVENTICGGALDLFAGHDVSTISTLGSNLIPSIPTSDIPTINTIDPNVGDTFNLPGITEPGVPAYVMDLANNEMASLGSIAGLAAPVTGTVSSEGIGNFLAPDPFMNLGTLFDSTLASIFADTPLTFTSTLPLDWTNLVAESLQSLFTT
ncbi:hypothetical protein [Mycobacterium sp.]|uniref:hypothetical protein n=1 Tax=Mycobacterium sp. TaxID=1785 RepID=UPI003D0F0DB3